MTKDEMQIAVAESLGLLKKCKDCEGEKSVLIESDHDYYITCKRCRGTGQEPIPNYPEDLNAMREAILTLLRLGNSGEIFILTLWEVTGLQKLRGPLLLSTQSHPFEFNTQINKIWELWAIATAEHYCEAYLRTKGLWK